MRTLMTDEERRARLLLMGVQFFRCPHTGTVVESYDASDDKILCRCGLANPRCPTEAPGVHVKRFLTVASVDDYMRQRREHETYMRDPHAPDPRD